MILRNRPSLKELRVLLQPPTLKLIYKGHRLKWQIAHDRSQTYECTTCKWRTRKVMTARKHAMGCFPSTRLEQKRTMREAKKGRLLQL